MKTYITDIIPKIQKFSKKLDNLTLLTDQNWVFISGEETIKYIYIFRRNNELIISVNGRVEKGKWEYLGNNSILIEKKDESFLFRHGFFDENILALKVDGKEEYAFMVNEIKFGKEITSAEEVVKFLKINYMSKLALTNSENKIVDEIDTNKNSIGFSESEISYEEIVTPINPFIGAKYNKHSIRFEDGKSGVICYYHNYEKYYVDFKDRRIFYNTKESAIYALRYYLIYRKIIEKNRYIR